MKEIMFSRVFPAYHPRKGEPTYFVEQMLKQLIINGKASTEDLKGEFVNCKILCEVGYKGHTIRKGHNFKEGDYFKPKVWTVLPYKSVKHQFAPPVKVEKVYDFETTDGQILIDGMLYATPFLNKVAHNDGLTLADFWFWIKYPESFDGQIIVWNNEINY